MRAASPVTFPSRFRRGIIVVSVDFPRLALTLAAVLLTSCQGGTDPFEWAMSKAQLLPTQLRVGQRFPDQAENEVVGGVVGRVRRGEPRWQRFTACQSANVLFKDEERDGSDRYMTYRLCELTTRLGKSVAREWPGLSLRITEAWDDDGEHGRASLHYEGRAADLTTSDSDSTRLGRLARLAVDAGMDWVYFENRNHVHVSVRR